jgi:microcystin-dependent protein
VAGGRGATAAADWAANKPIALLAVLGRALGVAGAGSGLTSRALGQTAGVETQAIAQANLPAVSPTFAGTSPGVSFTQWNGTGGTEQSGGGTTFNPVRTADIVQTPLPTPAGTISALGSGTALNIMQPTTFLNVMIKL